MLSPKLPVTPPVGPIPHVQITDADLAALDDMLVPRAHPHVDADADAAFLLHDGAVAAPHPKSQSWRRRDAPLDPLLFAAAAASGPHVTRHHYHHDFFPAALALGEDDDWPDQLPVEQPPRYVSKQAPRSQRIGQAQTKKNNAKVAKPALGRTPRLPRTPSPLHRGTTADESAAVMGVVHHSHHAMNFTPPPFDPENTAVQVQCLSRARIPTPHGPAFLHLYHNNRDDKEHLAIVVDPAQLEGEGLEGRARPIRSRTLEAVWSAEETETDRIVRGAYVGRLTETARTPSAAAAAARADADAGVSHVTTAVPAPLVRIHSECFTGETIGSMRCDCGEQLDEALRLISLPLPGAGGGSTRPGRGAVVYMRQEGRGIGLLAKLRAYNLQDMGHDTVSANLALGHGADERGYAVAAAILRDLGLAGAEGAEGVRLLTNNPDKVHALQTEGVRVVERVGMVPRSWQCRQHDHSEEVHPAGITLLGAGAAHGEELDKYLRTKVERMGHMLPLPPPSAH